MRRQALHVVTSLWWQAPSPAYSGSSLYPPDAVASSGPIISDITELAPGSPLASAGGSVAERWARRLPGRRERVGLAEAPADTCAPCAGPCPAAPWFESRRSPPAHLGAPRQRMPVPASRPPWWRRPCPRPPSLIPSCGRASLRRPPRPRPSLMPGAAPRHPGLPRPPRSASA